MTTLIPQLPTAAAMPLLSEISYADQTPLDAGIELEHPQAFTLPTGGFPLPEAHLRELRDAVVAAAREHGFPESRPTSFLGFELKVAEILATWEPLWVDGCPSGEALRNDCWTFLTVIVMPDIALWRWPLKGETSPDSKAWRGRMLGGGRNAFQRIFRRVMCLDRGVDHSDRWGLIRDLQEDDFSAILERPGLSSNRNIAICLGEEYLAMKQRLKHLGADVRQDVYRQATKAIRAYGVVQPFDLLSAEDRAQIIHDAFIRQEQRLAAGQPASVALDSPSAVQEPPAGSETPPAPGNAPAAPEPSGLSARPGFLRRLLQGG